MTLKAQVRAGLRRSRGWVGLRRLQREGFGRAFRRWRLWSQILKTEPTPTDVVADGAPVEVHLLCYERDYLCAIWALKSFYHFSRVRYPLVIHLQGRTTRRMERRLRRHFPAARIVAQADADSLVEEWLTSRGFLRLLAARRANPFMLKLTDFALLSNAVHLLTLDPDLVFFRRPSELLIASGAPLPTSIFQRDPVSTYNITEEKARAELGVDLAPRVNTGVMLFPRRSLELSRCEKFMAHPEVARSTGWIEQTLYALCASEQRRVAYLPESYLLSLQEGVDQASLVMRHYAGPSRPLLTEEGMTRLVETGFLRSISATGTPAAGRPPVNEEC